MKKTFLILPVFLFACSKSVNLNSSRTITNETGSSLQIKICPYQLQNDRAKDFPPVELQLKEGEASTLLGQAQVRTWNPFRGSVTVHIGIQSESFRNHLFCLSNDTIYVRNTGEACRETEKILAKPRDYCLKTLSPK